MKRLFSIALIFSVFCASSFAQEVFKKKDMVLNLGIGLGNSLHTANGYSVSVPPVSASLEYGVVDGLLDGKASIGVGGYVGYTASKWKAFGYESTVSDVIIGARGSFHYQFVDKLDTYAGLMLGYDVVSWSDNVGNSSNNVASSGLIIPMHIGARYYVADNIAVMGELGYGISYLNVGAAIKF